MDYVLYISDSSCHYLYKIASIFQATFFCDEQVSHTRFNLELSKVVSHTSTGSVSSFSSEMQSFGSFFVINLEDEIALALSRNSLEFFV